MIPIFALANAGIPLAFGWFGETPPNPVMLGVLPSLVPGKFIGITGASWIVLKLGLAELPKDTRLTQIAGVSLLAGIGFTISIFVAEPGLGGREDLLLITKTGILAAALPAGVVGFIWLYLLARPAAAQAG